MLNSGDWSCVRSSTLMPVPCWILACLNPYLLLHALGCISKPKNQLLLNLLLDPLRNPSFANSLVLMWNLPKSKSLSLCPGNPDPGNTTNGVIFFCLPQFSALPSQRKSGVSLFCKTSIGHKSCRVSVSSNSSWDGIKLISSAGKEFLCFSPMTGPTD